MSKPVTPQEMFDLWQKMVNPGAYPLQSLMFPVLDAKEIDKKISELEVVEHWLKANLNMLQLSIKSLEFQKGMAKGGEVPNPAMWAWNMMAQAGKQASDAAQEMMQPKPQAAKKRRKPG